MECIESHTKKEELKGFIDLFNTLFDKMSEHTANIWQILTAIKKVLAMNQAERVEQYKSLSTNMPYQNSTEENLQLIVLEYLYTA